MPNDIQRQSMGFDHDSAEHAENWPAEFRDMRHKHPNAWTDNHGGFWVATRYHDIIKISQKPDTFSTHKVLDPVTGEAKGGNGIPTFPSIRMVPNESESPLWNSARTFLNPRFAPKAVLALREKTKQFTTATVDKFIEKGRVDFVEELAGPVPAIITMHILGLRLDEWPLYADAVHKMSALPKNDPERPKALKWLSGYIKQRVDEEIALRRKNPTDDLLTHFAIGKMDGQPLEDQMIYDMTTQVIFGGLDTTTSLTSAALHHLGLHPADKQRLIDDPKLLPVATEEFLRYFTPVHGSGRTIKHDIDIEGWKLPAGDRIWLAFSSANRDEAVFEDPDTLKLDRLPNRHIGFGAGLHRCLGSFLARQTFEIIITEVLTRLPDFKVLETECERYPSVGFSNGWNKVHATFTPGKKVGAQLA